MLESQLQAERQGHMEELEAVRAELQVLKEERDQQQHLLSDSLQQPHNRRVNAALQNEISRLTRHNVVSMEAVEQFLNCYLLCVRIFAEVLVEYIFLNNIGPYGTNG